MATILCGTGACAGSNNNAVRQGHHRAGGRAFGLIPRLMGGWAVCVLAGTALSQAPILEVYAASKTTYKPAAATGIQDLRPLNNAQQRGVNLDGTARLPSPYGWGIQGNPFEGNYGPASLGDVRIDTGTYTPTEIDLALPSAGLGWVVGRTFNARQETSSPAHRDSNGYQGKNWGQVSQPEIAFYDADSDSGTRGDDDVVTIVYGADRFIEFDRTAANVDTFQGKNGAAGIILFAANASGVPDTFTYYDQIGNIITFMAFDGDSGSSAGQLWRMEDAAGNVSFVGSSTLDSNTDTTGYLSGKIELAYDPAGRRYTYTYSTIDSVSRLTQVKAETKTGGTWASPTGVAEVGKVEYEYYQTGDNTYGDNGNLMLVTTTTPLTDSGVSDIRRTYYRYWKGTYNASTNPGHPNTIQYVMHPEGTRAFDWTDSNLADEDFLSASESSIKPYTSHYFEYDSTYRISEVFANGECGCSGGSNGTHTFTYGVSSYTDGAARRTVIARPDGTYQTVYFTSTGEANADVLTDGDPTGSPNKNVTEYIRNGDGQVTSIRTPAANNGYTHNTGDFTVSTSVGLVTFLNRYSSTHVKGFLNLTSHATGDSVTRYHDLGWAFADDSDSNDTPETTVTVAIGGVDLYRPVRWWDYRYPTQTTTTVYPTAGTSDTEGVVQASSTTLAFDARSHSALPVATADNGGNTAAASVTSMRLDGTTAFTKDPADIITYTAYTNGQVTTRVSDADTGTLAGGGVTIPSGFSSSGTELHLVTTYAYDAQGRLNTTTAPDGTVSQMYYTKLADGRLVTISIPRVSGGNFFGPAGITVSNHAGKPEVSGMIAIDNAGIGTALTGWIGETDSDAAAAVDVGTLTRVSTTIYDEAGARVEETRAYHTAPTSLPGTEGTDYDATRIGYDDLGRKRRIKDTTDTITRTVFDALGRPTQSWIGTNDNGDAGGESSGTNNMVKVATTTYDGGAGGGIAGNGLVTSRTMDPDGNWGTTGDQRTTTYTHDVRGRTLLTTNPQAPHTLVKYDNQGHMTASAQYTSTASITVGTTDPAGSATNDKANRVALSETFYDSRWQVYKTTRHKINQSTGASEDTLDTLTWYDSVGRVLKSQGSSLTKTKYDRLGRATNRYVLASDDDATESTDALRYAAAATVDDDTVLEEHQTYYEADTGLALMSVSIQRHPNDTTTITALDTDSDLSKVDYTTSGGKIKGRAQITAMWYDDWHRMTGSLTLGTNGGSDYDRDGQSLPTRSDTELVTTTSYNTDGTVLDVTDPKGIVARTLYDAAGRVTKRIANYVNGIAGGGAADDEDQTIAFEYTNGLQTKYTADLSGTDQDTVYTYGVPKGTGAGDSAIASNRLLWKVAYPDTSGGTDVVTTAYNALGQVTYVKDQSGNIIDTSYDTAGRQTSRVASTVIGGFDSAVRAIAMAYLSRGNVDTVTQYSNTGMSTATDQVQYDYDGWGNMTGLTQDVDGVIGAGGITARAVSYTYAKNAASGKPNVLRRTGQTLPGSFTLNYLYTGTVNDNASRLYEVNIEAGTPDVPIATYEYLGMGQVVTTTLPEPVASTGVFSSGSTTYPDIDTFGRITTNDWWRGSSAAYVNLGLAYDRNGNITAETDALVTRQVTGGAWTAGDHYFDRVFTNDSLNRLAKADEGHKSGSTIASSKHTRIEEWTLSQTGNWDNQKLDLNGDGDQADGSERNWNSTFNAANEFTVRDGVTPTPTHDPVGNMVDDAKYYTYVYDVFGRLKTVKTRGGSPVTVSEYTYNGLGHRVGWHYDADTDADVDGSDPWYYFFYDERWRVVATYRGSDANPKERFVYHNAGANGYGGSSYIDSTILRDTDDSVGWATAAPDSTLETRYYYLQNWRADVVALIEADGDPLEYVRYSPYGVPYVYGAGDVNRDGQVSILDNYAWDDFNQSGTGDMAVDDDVNRDGTVDSDDVQLITDQDGWGAWAGDGRGFVSGVSSRKGYAGYEFDPATTQWHVRHRVLVSEMGRWSRRDPLERQPAARSYLYAESSPHRYYDWDGRLAIIRVAGFTPGPCGKYYVAWDFMLDSPAPCEGYFVQEVYSDLSECWCSPSCKSRTVRFWEAWHVRQGDRTTDLDGPDDTFYEGTHGSRYGSSYAVGTVGFYCSYITGNLDNDWPSDVPDSGEIPSTSVEPSWIGRWIEGPADHGASVKWNCCGTTKESLNSNSEGDAWP